MYARSAFIKNRSLLAYTERIIAAYRGWDAFERAHGGPQIIDFDLSKISHTDLFNTRGEILATLKDLYEQVDDSSHEGEFLQAKLQGSLFYLRALMGQQIPFDEYLQHTLVPHFRNNVMVFGPVLWPQWEALRWSLRSLSPKDVSHAWSPTELPP
jgi:hypothetical protein